MPKITHGGGPSIQGSPPVEQNRDPATQPPEGGEPASVGTDYLTSSESPSLSGEPSSQDLESPAPTTESLSQPEQETSGTADTAGGVTSEPEPEPVTRWTKRRR